MPKRAFFVFSLAIVFGALSAPAGAQSPNSTQGPPPQGQANGQNPGPDRRPGGPRLAGTVTSVGVDRFEIKSIDGSAHTILVDDQTRYRESQKDIQLEDLKVGDHVMVMGKMSPAGPAATAPAAGGSPAAPPVAPPTAATSTPGGSDQAGFTAAMVRRMTDADLARASVGGTGGMGGSGAGERVFGEIVSIDNNQLKVRNPRTGDQTLVVVDAQTTFLKDNQPIALKDLKVGDRIFAVGKTANGQFTATRVMTGQMRGGGGFRQRPPNPEN